MRTLSTLLLTASLLAHIHGQSIYDISDVPAYSSLAPCAMSAVSYNVYTLTNSLCPDGITALQSCACTKAGVSGKVALTISSDALYSCGSTASEDISSAASVFAQYCNQDAPLPTPNIRNEAVTHEITELPYYSELAPCARSAVSYAVNSMTNYLCRDGAPELNSCVCTKNQNSFRVSRSIASDVRYSCGSTRSADVASALALFDGYCAMGAGTTSFPTVSQLKGDVSYYVDDLPAFGSLADCAASAVSYGVYSFTNYFCNGGPKALASCVCEKDDNSALASKEIVSDVQWSCSSDATEDINSALAVFSEYCGAARGELEVVGVTASGEFLTCTIVP